MTEQTPTGKDRSSSAFQYGESALDPVITSTGGDTLDLYVHPDGQGVQVNVSDKTGYESGAITLVGDDVARLVAALHAAHAAAVVRAAQADETTTLRAEVERLRRLYVHDERRHKAELRERDAVIAAAKGEARTALAERGAARAEVATLREEAHLRADVWRDREARAEAEMQAIEGELVALRAAQPGREQIEQAVRSVHIGTARLGNDAVHKVTDAVLALFRQDQP